MVYFICDSCKKEYPKSHTYYRDDKLCGWCGHKIEFSKPAESLQDIVPITRLIVSVNIKEGI